MNTQQINNAISANNNGLIIADGYELALVKNGKIVATGNPVNARVFDATGDQFIECFNKIVDIRQHNTPQHNYTTNEGVTIPHSPLGANA